ncbi:protein of unknown function [Cupriavidus sp. YR651]|uniref:DUF4124 domain-containing protein n=1 Tax=Cupriavidus sp. YR651 TaxID=1855315 RepID=UPI00088104FD|nr:DUF4124 domain-containing protein [Cupriavidus sp. YR651]SDC02434.1 protein of unknown function [Cupriavidus sp. YR651]
MNRSSALYLLVAAAVAVPGTAFSQWQWKDSTGRMVYSDVPPPPSVPDRAVIMAPGRAPGAYRPVEADAAAKGDSIKAEGQPDARPEAPRARPASARVKDKTDAPADPDQAFRERREARLKADLEAATKEREQLARQTRCQELSNYATGLREGMRVSKAGADGAAHRLSGEEREAELAKMNDSISQHCS